jgi:transmembrane sensor
MSHYKEFSAEDFALDEHFQKWVLSPDNETARFWQHVIETNPNKRDTINEAIQLVKASGISLDQEANRAYLQVWENVRRNAEIKGSRAGTRLPLYASLAAAMVVLAIVSIYLLRSSSVQPREYRAAYGEIKEVKLDDGSTVTLNANSSLKLSESWNTKERQVLLEGEAFFNVVKTPDRKLFQVLIPNGLTIEVLGTTFNVNTRRESSSIYLQSGIVRLQHAAESVTLKPGELADYEKSLQRITVTRANAEASDKLAWRNNLYIMNDFSLSTIARDIEDIFGKKVVMMDSTLNERRVTAKVPARDMNVWLQVLSETLNLEIVERGNEIIITGRQ